MSSITHDIDPNGDLIVVLKNPNTAEVIPNVSLRREDKLGENDPTFAPDTTDVKRPLMLSGLPNNAAIARESDEIRFRVSSAHLELASVVFEKMFNGPWKESKAVNDQSDSSGADTEDSSPSNSPDEGASSSGSVTSSADPSPPNPSASRIPPKREVAVTEWHAHALLTVFNIIHGKNSRVPRNVSLEFVAQVALIAHFYDCAEALSIVVESWHHKIYKRSEKFGKETIMWLFISWVFSWPELFSGAARLIVRGGEGLNRITIHDLPIIEILEKLDKQRKAAIRELTKLLTTVDGLLKSCRKGCNATCRAVMIGSLAVEKFNNGDLTCLHALVDVKAVSLSKFIAAIHNFTPTKWYDSSGCAHPCSVVKLILPTVGMVEGELRCLNLSDHKHKV